ncbi:hypothetical protein HanPI659440_Chr16g0632061 [Helianthus annuus]|nr:hypothetical protein HanPI659440_Chr16g0632061 [Helianthus annuus]
MSQMIKWVYKIVSSSSHCTFVNTREAWNSNLVTSSKPRMRVVLPTADNHCGHKPHITKKKGNIFRVHQLIRKDFLKALLFGFLDSISISLFWGFIWLLVTEKVFRYILPTQLSVEEVIKMMEMDLGDGWIFHKHCKVYLFISSHRVAGCLVAEPIKKGHR